MQLNVPEVYMSCLLFGKKPCESVGSSHEQDDLPVQVDEESSKKATKDSV